MIKTDHLTQTLIEMGYEPDIIALATAESINKTLEEVLDLLLFRENKYQKYLVKKKEKGIPPKLNKKYSIDDKSDKFERPKKAKLKNYDKSDSDGILSDEDWIDEDLIDQENPVEVMKIGFGQLPHHVMLGKSKPEKESSELESIMSGSKDPSEILDIAVDKSMDEECALYVQNITRSLTELNSKDINDYIVKMLGILGDIRNNNNKLNKLLRTYMVSEGRYSLIFELKNQIYAILNKMFGMKIKKKINPDVRKLEKCLQFSFEMQLLSSKQMKYVLSLYASFCEKVDCLPDTLLLAQLEKLCLDMENKRPTPWVTSLKKENNRSQAKNGLKSEVQAKEKLENHTEDKDEASQEPTIFNLAAIKATAVEDCVICMERTREVVFLPCSHFLTCPLCSPRVMKCPMCNKMIEKHLKIHWS